jgi:hypothetical protein
MSSGLSVTTRSFLLAALIAGASLGVGGAAQPVPLDEIPEFRNPEAALVALLDQRGASGTHEFCVVAFREGKEERAWVWWKQGNALILWEPETGPDAALALVHSRRFLDLEKDVVATDEEIAGSTYRVSHPWVTSLLRNCEMHGKSFRITPRRRGPGSKSTDRLSDGDTPIPRRK